MAPPQLYGWTCGETSHGHPDTITVSAPGVTTILLVAFLSFASLWPRSWKCKPDGSLNSLKWTVSAFSKNSTEECIRKVPKMICAVKKDIYECRFYCNQGHSFLSWRSRCGWTPKQVFSCLLASLVRRKSGSQCDTFLGTKEKSQKVQSSILSHIHQLNVLNMSRTWHGNEVGQFIISSAMCDGAAVVSLFVSCRRCLGWILLKTSGKRGRNQQNLQFPFLQFWYQDLTLRFNPTGMPWEDPETFL